MERNEKETLAIEFIDNAFASCYIEYRFNPHKIIIKFSDYDLRLQIAENQFIDLMKSNGIAM
jgi:hypothetical protein